MVADRLANRHFTAQAELPVELAQLDMGELDPFMRGLLVTDGTVSRTLEANSLRAVEVEPVEQSEAPPPAAVARHLQLAQHESCLRRRIVMRIAGPDPTVWAESYVVPQRLPPAFLQALSGHSRGIGGSLEQLKLESWRELLWFGLGTPPDWPEPARTTSETLTRAYLIMMGGRPALLISEHFGMSRNGGGYSLAGAAPDAHEDR